MLVLDNSCPVKEKSIYIICKSINHSYNYLYLAITPSAFINKFIHNDIYAPNYLRRKTNPTCMLPSHLPLDWERGETSEWRLRTLPQHHQGTPAVRCVWFYFPSQGCVQNETWCLSACLCLLRKWKEYDLYSWLILWNCCKTLLSSLNLICSHGVKTSYINQCTWYTAKFLSSIWIICFIF